MITAIIHIVEQPHFNQRYFLPASSSRIAGLSGKVQYKKRNETKIRWEKAQVKSKQVKTNEEKFLLSQ